MCVLRLVTFNRHRFTSLVQQHRLHKIDVTPSAIARLEGMPAVWFQLPSRIKEESRIEMGVCLSDLCFGVWTCDDIDRLRTDDPYIITCHPSMKRVRVAFMKDISVIDELRFVFLVFFVFKLKPYYCSPIPPFKTFQMLSTCTLSVGSPGLSNITAHR